MSAGGITSGGRARWRAALIGGTVGGALDLAFALAFAATGGTTPVQLLQTIASGLLGAAAYDGGIGTAVLGLAAHFAMSYGWAAAFVLAAGHLPRLAARPVLAGALFGILVFFTMRLVVLPLSAFPHPVTFRPLAWGLDLLSHMFLFGLPIALAAARRPPPGP
jgi:uncharacterized membrane protein YagU involved in acid resistance